MESLTLEQSSYLAEIFGVIAIVISLAYVGRQIAQNSRSQRLTAILAHNDAHRSNDTLLAEYSEIFVKGLQEFSELNDPEKIRFGTVIQALVRHLEQTYYMYKEGVLRESTYHSATSQVNGVMHYPGVKAWWQTRRAYFDPDFRESLESYMEENEDEYLYHFNKQN